MTIQRSVGLTVTSVHLYGRLGLRSGLRRLRSAAWVQTIRDTLLRTAPNKLPGPDPAARRVLRLELSRKANSTD